MFNNIPYIDSENNTVFYCSGSYLSSTAWQTWTKPLGISFISICTIGGGGGGGRSTNAVTGGGGGGGGAGNLFSTVIPAWLLPDTLYVRVGYGGPGATTSGGTGTTGGTSYVTFYPDVSSSLYTIAVSGGGSGGTATSGGAGNASVGNTLRPWGNLGMCPLLFSASAGAASITSVNAGNMARTGGAGGGSNAGAGGDITGNELLATIAGGANGGFPGQNGVWMWKPRFGTGGSGGGGGNGGTGGRGGDGAYGCGGGGGGASSGTSGNGGNGGDGLVIIDCW